MNKSILAYNLNELSALCKTHGQPSFRAGQLIRWLYKEGVSSYEDMTNLPKSFRYILEQEAPLIIPRVVDKQISADGTRKYVIEYSDGARVECVGIPSGKNLSVCFSTQVGCPMQCAFCATGAEGFTRNLSTGEILMQLVLTQQDFGKRISHAVSMGQGEPFLNYDATLESLRFLNDKQGFGIGARHLTLSTCGITSGINKLAQEPEQFTLAISLHAGSQNLRNRLMPQCRKISLTELKSTLLQYVELTNRRISLEYLMLAGINDDRKDLEALQNFCDGLLCHINLIPFNNIDGLPYKASSSAVLQEWIAGLKGINKEVTIRHSRGADINGACGQLKNRMSLS